MKKRTRRLLTAAAIVAGLALLGAVAIPLWTHGDSGAALASCESENVSTEASKVPPAHNDGTLTVMTLNVAHGRKRGFHQALKKRATIESNLDDIADVLKREGPDVVALQEADGPSGWSGGFNHVEYLAVGGGLEHFCRGEHVKGMKLSYGTALLSRLPLEESRSVTFAPSPPTFSKGFVVATVAWPGRPDSQVDVVSVHLDFARKSVRGKQIQKLIDELSARENPLIVMGDFNCQWDGKDKSLRTLAEGLDLVAPEPAAGDMATFPKTGKRLDWILASPELEFVEYRTVTDVLSDHYGVVAVLRTADGRATGKEEP